MYPGGACIRGSDATRVASSCYYTRWSTKTVQIVVSMYAVRCRPILARLFAVRNPWVLINHAGDKNSQRD